MESESNSEAETVVVLELVSPYTYQPLQTHTTIRLINLYPCHESNIDKRLKCHLTVVDLSDNPSFLALSYTWGENVFPEKLFCDDKVLDITANLHAALLRLRLPDKPLRIWVDAVCIDQTHDAEKTHQIPLMGSIYGQASEVLIWLGEASGESEDVMKFLKHIGQLFVDRGGPIREPRDDRSPENDLIWAEVLRDPMLENGGVIWTRPWFSRRWIIQEVALAKRATVHCGTVSMDWNVLAHANNALSRLAGDGSHFWNEETNEFRHLMQTCSINMGNLCQIREEMWIVPFSPKKRRIHRLMDQARAFDCREAKDRVFALLAIFNRGRDNPFRIDYSRSEADVYLAFARYCLQNDITVDVLSFAGTGNHSIIPDHIEIPSWVADWRFPFITTADALNHFDAGYRLASLIVLSSSPDSRDLLTRGIIFDKVGALVRPLSHFHEPGASSPFILSQPQTFFRPRHVATWYDQVIAILDHCFRSFLTTTYPYIAGGDIQEALAKTLILDRNDVIFDYRRDRPERSHGEESTPLYQQWRGFHNNMLTCAQNVREGRPEYEIEEGSLSVITYEQMEYHRLPPLFCENRSFFVTAKGYIGLGPRDMTLGDVVVVMAGSGVPHILRPESGNAFRLFGSPGWPPVLPKKVGVVVMPDSGGTRPYVLRHTEETYSLVGEAYVHGLMNDEVWDLEGIVFEDLRIV